MEAEELLKEGPNFCSNLKSKKAANIQNNLVNERASTAITPGDNQNDQNNKEQEENRQLQDNCNIQGTFEEGKMKNFHNTILPEKRTRENNPIIEERRKKRRFKQYINRLSIKTSFSQLTDRLNHLFQEYVIIYFNCGSGNSRELSPLWKEIEKMYELIALRKLGNLE